MFSMLSRAVLWIIRGIGYVVGVIGMIMIALRFLMKGNEELLIPGIIMFVVGLIIVGVTRKMTDKLISAKMKRCKRCRKILRGAQYRYEYNRGDYNKIYSLLPVTFEIVCPHCGKTNTKIENVPIADITCSEGSLQSSIEKWMNEQVSGS